METFLPSPTPASGVPVPAASPASPVSKGDRIAAAEAGPAPDGLFLQILMTSCSVQAPADAPLPLPADGESAEAPEAAGEEIVSGEDGSMGPAVAGMPEAGLLAASVPPPSAGGAVHADPPSPVNAAPPDGTRVSAAVEPLPARDPAGDAPVRAPQAETASAEAVLAQGARAESAPADAAPKESTAAKPAPAGDAPAHTAPRDAGTRTAAAASGTTAVGPFAEAAAAAAKEAPSPPAVRNDAPPSAPRDGEPKPVPAVSAGKPSAASEGPDPADALEPAEKKKIETVFRTDEPAEPAVLPSVAVGRNAAPAARSEAAGPADAPAPKMFQAGEHAFVVTRATDRSVEVTLSPPGIGKLEIEVVLEKGIVNANITAADAAGRDAIERSLPQILESLARDGMAVGGFTVSLKQGGRRDGDAAPGKAAAASPKDGSARGASAAPVRGAARPSGLVDLFV